MWGRGGGVEVCEIIKIANVLSIFFILVFRFVSEVHLSLSFLLLDQNLNSRSSPPFSQGFFLHNIWQLKSICSNNKKNWFLSNEAFLKYFFLNKNPHIVLPACRTSFVETKIVEAAGQYIIFLDWSSSCLRVSLLASICS